MANANRLAPALLAAFFALLLPAAASAATTGATFTKTSDWGNGFVANYVIGNGGSSAMNGWKLEFDLQQGQSLTSAWSSKMTRQGDHYVFTPEDWTRNVAAGGSVQIGFQGAYSGTFEAPKNCTLNGQPCAGGTTTPPVTPPPVTPPPVTPPPVTPPATSGLGAKFAKTDDWGSGFNGEFVITNGSGQAISGWKIEFDLSAGQTIGDAWDGKVSSSGNHYVLTNESWNKDIPAGGSTKVGFGGSYSGAFQAPKNCTINGQACEGGSTTTPPVTLPPVTPPSGPVGRAFAPYHDMTLQGKGALPAFVRGSGVKSVSLAFIVSKGACQASWGGFYGLNDGDDWFNAAQSIADARAAGAEPIISFGGAAGQELARTCSSVSSLAAQYQAVIDKYNVRNLDFDIEGSDQGDPVSLERRFKAIAQIQQAGAAAGKPVRVSLTLPVMPTGLTHLGLGVVQSAIANGVDVSLVNVMAMDYYDPSLSLAPGKMGDYAVQAAESLHTQLASLYPQRSSAQLWAMVGVTPMIGINDNPPEIFTIADAQKLVAFASQKGLGRLAMWSSNRDQPCPGPRTLTENLCSGTAQSPYGFSSVFRPFGA